MRDLLHYFTLWNKKKKGLILLFLFGSISFLQAQKITVTGTVSDATGTSIPGANITIKGSLKGTSTSFDGSYSIAAMSNDVLVFSFLGLQTREIPIDGRKTLNITLKDNTENLKEVVVIGYGSQKRKNVTGAISSVKAEDIENIKQVSIDQMLQGKAAGVSLSNNSGQPGGATSVRVRGTTSLNNTNEPLYIIDGVPVTGDATSKASGGQPLAGNNGFSSEGGNIAVSPLTMINPNDIQSIDILKDASATAIYGSRGANGVIIITTKSGKKGSGKITYENFISFQSIYKKLNVLNLSQYAAYQNALAEEFGLTPRPEFAHPELLGEGTNWQDEIYRMAIAKNHQLSFSGAKDGTNYYLSAGYLDQDAVIIGSGYKRYTIRLNLNSDIKPWLKVGTNLNGGITNEKITVNQSFTGLISNTLLQAPDMPVRDINGSYASPPSGQNVNYFNPVEEALTRDNKLVRKNFLGNIYAEASLAKGLKYRMELSANTEFSENTDFAPSRGGSYSNLTADLFERRQNWYSTNIKNLLTYDFTLGNHHFTLLGGQEALDSHWEGILSEGHGFKTNSVFSINLSDADTRKVNGYKGSQALQSLFGRLIYDFNDKYSIAASIRRDVSSKFDQKSKNKEGIFRAVSGSWKLSNESFMENTKKYIDNIKFRVGYGETGNQQIPNNLFTSILAPQSSGLGSGFLPSNIPNPNLKWESLNQSNIGLDFTLLDSRISASIDVYNKKSKDFLFKVPLPDYLTGGESFYGGQSAPYSNLGSMQNKGYDITLGYTTKNIENFSWSSSLNFSHYQNEILSIPDGLALFEKINTNGYLPVVVTNSVVGNPMGMFYGYQAEGLFTSLEQLNAAPIQFGQSVGTAAGQTYLGDVKYKDTNGDGKIDEGDKTLMGNPHPDFTFGFTNTFKYKNVDFSVFVQGSQGNEILNLTKRSGTSNASLYTNQLVEAANFWTPTNTNTNIPRAISSNTNHNLEISDRYVEDGSYVRIQNVTLGYSFPQSFLSKAKISKVRLYGSVQNLHTFTKYSGYDPEIGSFNQSPLLTGIDNGRYPSPRTYTIGFNLEF